MDNRATGSASHPSHGENDRSDRKAGDGAYDCGRPSQPDGRERCSWRVGDQADHQAEDRPGGGRRYSADDDRALKQRIRASVFGILTCTGSLKRRPPPNGRAPPKRVSDVATRLRSAFGVARSLVKEICEQPRGSMSGGFLRAVLRYGVLPRRSVDGQNRPRAAAVLAAQLNVEASTVVLDAKPMRIVAVFVQDPSAFRIGHERRPSVAGHARR